MWNSFDTKEGAFVTAETISFVAGGGDSIHAYTASPGGDGPYPGLVLVHHAPGWDEFYQEFAERLARHGYRVICPDLYCRFGHGRSEDVRAIVQTQGGVHDDSVVADCAAARDWLRAQGCTKVGIIGSCSGGRHAFLTAELVGGFDAVVELWGGGVVASAEELTPARPVAPIDYTPRLEAPLLGIFGNDDRTPSPDQVDTHEAALKEHGKDYEFHRYDGAGHGFFYYHTDRYRPVQAMDGWSKIFAFFERTLHS